MRFRLINEFGIQKIFKHKKNIWYRFRLVNNFQQMNNSSSSLYLHIF